MDNQIADELRSRTEKAEASITRLERRVEFLTQKLDEARRAVRLSSIIDEQLAAINARVPYGRGDAA